MDTLFSSLTTDLAAIRSTSPVILNLTNYVAMDFNANALLALGASPIMAHAEEELAELVQIAGAVVINIGTLDERWIQSMRTAAKLATEARKPLVLDPVGAGATALRTRVAQTLLAENKFSVVRGNASEIAAVAGANGGTRGVDSALRSESVEACGKVLAKRYGLTVTISGETDYVLDGRQVARIANGTPLMTRVTAMGCTATSLLGAFLSVNPSPFHAAAHTMALMGVCGEIAREKSTGPGSFRVAFLDAIASFGPDSFSRLRVEIA